MIEQMNPCSNEVEGHVCGGEDMSIVRQTIHKDNLTLTIIYRIKCNICGTTCTIPANQNEIDIIVAAKYNEIHPKAT